MGDLFHGEKNGKDAGMKYSTAATDAEQKTTIIVHSDLCHT